MTTAQVGQLRTNHTAMEEEISAMQSELSTLTMDTQVRITIPQRTAAPDAHC